MAGSMKITGLMNTASCPLFTERHGRHSSAWCIAGFTLPSFCVACVVERLEEKKELSVNLKKIISETNSLLSPRKNELLMVLKSDKRVLERLSASLYSKNC